MTSDVYYCVCRRFVVDGRPEGHARGCPTAQKQFDIGHVRDDESIEGMIAANNGTIIIGTSS